MRQTDEAQAQREERGGELREGSVKCAGAATVEMARDAFAPFLPGSLLTRELFQKVFGISWTS